MKDRPKQERKEERGREDEEKRGEGGGKIQEKR